MDGDGDGVGKDSRGFEDGEFDDGILDGRNFEGRIFDRGFDNWVCSDAGLDWGVT
jgi:hypothetical protein